MAAYEFAVLGGDQSVLMRSTFDLESGRAAWAEVAALAWRLGDIKAQIRVANSAGELVILTGVGAVRAATSMPESDPKG